MILTKSRKRVWQNNAKSNVQYPVKFNALDYTGQQYGFTKEHRCTLTANTSVTLPQYIFKAREDATGIFCDLFKAFDCMNHEKTAPESWA